MGLLKEGRWYTQWYDTDSTGGEFKRDESRFRRWITPDGTPGPGDRDALPAESGRYHLYVSYACPWAHRTLIFRRLKGLEPHIGLSVVDPEMLEHGWSFSGRFELNHDPIHHVHHLYELYTRAKADYTGRVTVPVLWDRKTDTIVNNESAEIIRIFNRAFDDITGNAVDYCPDALRSDIDAVNERVYRDVNNGVYKCGFATTQEAYEEAFGHLFNALDWLEQRLSRQRYLVGEQLTEADWRLFTTLLRFDAVYHGHFKCNLRRIVDYRNLWGYLRELYQVDDVAGTVFMDQIKTHYYVSHDTINPTRIVPVGPAIDFKQPHGRERVGR